MRFVSKVNLRVGGPDEIPLIKTANMAVLGI
jgi:hypothetical protein